MVGKISIKDSLLIFLKGILMGISDVIPGVSGGTIALIVGIYERLINSIKEFNLTFIPQYTNYFITKNTKYLKNAKQSFSRIDFALFIPLGLGIIISLGIGSFFIPYLLDTYPVYMFSFFTGLILASIHLIYKRKLQKIEFKEIIFFVIGGFIAVYIIGLDALQFNHNNLIIFVSGMIAISAMLLPGISGSFLLLILGQYQYMLNALHNISTNFLTVLSFMLGAFVGLFGFARIIALLLKKYHSQTISFLIGLMVGSLRLPLRNIFQVEQYYPELGFIFGTTQIILTIIFVIVGISLVTIIEKKEKI